MEMSNTSSSPSDDVEFYRTLKLVIYLLSLSARWMKDGGVLNQIP